MKNLEPKLMLAYLKEYVSLGTIERINTNTITINGVRVKIIVDTVNNTF